MKRNVLPCVVCIVMASLVTCDNSWENRINLVPQSSNKSDDCTACNSDQHNCWNCYSLELCLVKANHLKSSVYIQIQSPGPFPLKQSIVLQYISSFALISSTPHTVVSCADNAGIAFISSNNIHLQNLQFVGCGASHYSTTTTTANNDFSFVLFPVSLYFSSCIAVSIDHVTIMSSPGAGVVLYNTGGTSAITDSTFSDSGPGHGCGVIIEYSFCVPGDYSSCVSPNQTQVSGAEFSIRNSSFTNNIAGGVDISPLDNNGKDYYGFGKGGGLSVVLKGEARNNVITLTDLNFTNNSAQYGAGLYAAFLDNATSNLISIEHSHISYSSSVVSSDTVIDVSAEGGGIMIMYGSQLGNRFTGKYLIFVGNTAQFNGGSLSVHSTQTSASASPSSLSLQGMTIQGSSARIGAAAYLISHYPSSAPVVTNISNCQFIDNELQTMCSSPGTTRCIATVYSSNYHLQLGDKVNLFKGNAASGIEIHNSTVTFAKESETHFEGNRAEYGGGILLADCAKILVDSKAEIRFTGNTAVHGGGGISVSGCSEFYSNFPIVGSSMECFVQHLHSTEWDNTIVFDNNRAKGAVNAIHSEELASCVQQSEADYNIREGLKTSALCAFSYKPSDHNCTSQITSGTTSLQVALSSKNLQVYPGQSFNVMVSSYNTYLHKIVESVKVCVKGGPGSLYETDPLGVKCIYVETTGDVIPVTLFSNYDSCRSFVNDTVLLSVRALSSSLPEVIVPIEMMSCPKHTNFGCPKCYLRVDQSHGIACANPEYCALPDTPLSEKCPLTNSLKISKIHCWNFVDSIDINSSSVLSQFIGGMCPYNYRTKFCEPISDFTFENQPSACPANRYGRLCGKCDKDHGIAINTGDMECITCYFHQLFSTWFLYLAIEFIYATILFMIVILAKLSLNAGGTSAFIFYCQVITMKFPGLSYPSWVLEKEYDYTYRYTIARGFTVIYSISNLDFIIPFAEPFCLSKNLAPIHAIMLEYIPAMYLLLLTTIVYCWVLLYRNHCNVIYRITNLITKNEHDVIYNRKCRYVPAYFDSLAVVTLLCYTRIATTSVKFLHATDYYNLQGENLGKAFFYDGTLDYFGDGHVFYAIIATAILAVLILPPAVFLTVYPLAQTYLCRDCQISTHSFSACFKDGTKPSKDHRYFAGIYLFLRIIIAFLYLERDIESLLISQISVAIITASLFMTLRPYKNDTFNTIDGLFFVYLALLSGLSANGYYSICQSYLIHLPLVTIILYGALRLVLFLARFRLKRIGQLKGEKQIDEDEDEPLLDAENGGGNDVEGLFTHRLLNPELTEDQPKNKRKKKSVALHDMST